MEEIAVSSALKQHHFWWRCLKTIGRESYRSWRKELLASVLVCAVSFGITWHRDPSAWENLRVGLISSAIVLGLFALWHCLHAPWLVHQEVIQGTNAIGWGFGLLGIFVIVGIASIPFFVWHSLAPKEQATAKVTPPSEQNHPPPSSGSGPTQGPKVKVVQRGTENTAQIGTGPNNKQMQIGAGAKVEARDCSIIGIDNTLTCVNSDPNKATVTYEANGDRWEKYPNNVTNVVPMNPPIAPIVQAFEDKKDWNGLLTWAQEKKSTEIGWLSPYFFIAMSHMHLCQRALAFKEFDGFANKTKEYPAYSGQHALAQDAPRYMGSEDYAKECPTPQ